MTSAYVFSETAVKRPIISTSTMTAAVATTIAQISPRPNFAPASPEVATVPTSRNPPVAVTIPSAIENHFFIDHQPLRTHYSHDSKPQPEHANHRTHLNMEHRPLVWPAYRDST